MEESYKVPKNEEQRIVYLSDIAKECVIDMQQRTAAYCDENKDDLLYPVFRKPYRTRRKRLFTLLVSKICDNNEKVLTESVILVILI